MSFVKDALVSIGVLNRRRVVRSPQARSGDSSRVRYSVVHDVRPTPAEAAKDLRESIRAFDDPEMIRVLGSPNAVANAKLVARHNLVQALGVPTQQQINAQLQGDELQMAIDAYNDFPDALHSQVRPLPNGFFLISG